MHTPVDEEIYRGHRIEILPDPDPESPRDFDTRGTVVCWHRRDSLDGESDLTMDALSARVENKAVILALYLSDQSGLNMNTTGFHCPWDACQVGYVYITLAEYGVKRVSTAQREKVAEVLRCEVAAYDDYSPAITMAS